MLGATKLHRLRFVVVGLKISGCSIEYMGIPSVRLGLCNGLRRD